MRNSLTAHCPKVWTLNLLRNCRIIDSDIIHRLAYYLCDINVLHPFREGNGRAQQLFIECIADHAGYKVDFSDATAEEMIIASAESFARDYDKINAMLERITTKK